MLGISAYAALVRRIVDELRPHILLVHPPYDHLNAAICEAIRASGTRIVGLGFDDALFADSWSDAALDDLRDRFDLWATTSQAGRTVEHGARPIPWALSPETVARYDAAAPAHEALLVGRKTPERHAVVAALTDAGVETGVYGAGWPAGSVSRARMLGLIRNAGVVITPNDGVDMIKARMLETALCGARQLIEYSAELSTYFPDELPPTWRTPGECVEWVTSGRAIDVWREVPRWTERWPQLLDGLTLADLDAPQTLQSDSLETLYAALAHTYEQRGLLDAAGAFFEVWAETSDAALSGVARCAHAQERWTEAITAADAALAVVAAPDAVRNLAAWVPSHGQGCGLGRTGALDPGIELDAIRLHARVMAGAVGEATAIAAGLDPSRRSRVSQVLQPDELAEREPFWRALRS